MTFDPEFKKALQLLPSDEKDKLILRLLKLNLPLADKLRFELVDTDTAEDKREQVKSESSNAYNKPLSGIIRPVFY